MAAVAKGRVNATCDGDIARLPSSDGGSQMYAPWSTHSGAARPLERCVIIASWRWRMVELPVFTKRNGKMPCKRQATPAATMRPPKEKAESIDRKSGV